MTSTDDLSNRIKSLVTQCREHQLSLPNILITGTPGVGKTEYSQQLAEMTTLQHLNISQLIRDAPEGSYDDGYNIEYDCRMLNEDKLCDYLDTVLTTSDNTNEESTVGSSSSSSKLSLGGYLVDFHSVEFMAERWYDLIIVLRCNNTLLYDRLLARNYNDKKLQENIECEIMNVVRDETYESYEEECIVELQNDTIEQMESNIQRTLQWLVTVVEKKVQQFEDSQR